jgi:hypothetical protein
MMDDVPFDTGTSIHAHSPSPSRAHRGNTVHASLVPGDEMHTRAVPVFMPAAHCGSHPACPPYPRLR